MNFSQFLMRTALTNFTDFNVDNHCIKVHEVQDSYERCLFVQQVSSCDYDGLVYNYTELFYCDLRHLHLILNFIILLAILLVFFISISLVADDFLCPSLLAISKTLRLPDNIAGVTFLAFGNGAPDIFSSIGGINQAKPNLVFSGLYGGGIFVTTVVTGSVLIFAPKFTLMKRPLIRDLVFYIGAAFMVWVIIYNEVLTLPHSISLIVYYVLYIVITFVSRFIYTRMNPKVEDLINDEAIENDNVSVAPETSISVIGSDLQSTKQESTSLHRTPSIRSDIILTRFYRASVRLSHRRDSTSTKHFAHHHWENTVNRVSKNLNLDRKASIVSSRMISPDEPKKTLPNSVTFTNNFKKTRYFKQFSTSSILSRENFSEIYSETKSFLIHACPVDILEWEQYSIKKKISELFKAVPYFVMTISIPVVDLESVNENWCRLLICLNILVGPQVLLFAVKQINYNVNQTFPLWSIVLIISIVLVFLVLLTSNKQQAPMYHRIFAFFGFIMSVIYINAVAEEIVSLLQTFGIVLKLTDSILGLTVLAWGNSLGDLIADVSMARNGFPSMAIAACFAGPMLNLLMGLGVPYLILFLGQHTNKIEIEYSKMMSLLYATLTISLCLSLISFVFFRFRSSKILGFLLIGIYLVYLVLAFLVEFKTI